MIKRSPCSRSIGRIQNQYISRSLMIEDIIDILNAELVEDQAFKITGIRGTGKTDKFVDFIQEFQILIRNEPTQSCHHRRRL